jgi:hypothetical protein
MATPKAAEAGLADTLPEVLEHGPFAIATVLPLLVSSSLSKFAAGVEAVIKSQASFTGQFICVHRFLLTLPVRVRSQQN